MTIFVHPSLLHSFIFAPCLTHSPPFRTKYTCAPFSCTFLSGSLFGRFSSGPILSSSNIDILLFLFPFRSTFVLLWTMVSIDSLPCQVIKRNSLPSLSSMMGLFRFRYVWLMSFCSRSAVSHTSYTLLHFWLDSWSLHHLQCLTFAPRFLYAPLLILTA